ncbi:MAG TPA: hypothetical protein VF669_07390 [Tepidisphaeraceae bacterium]|jgi:hypothetical protein
MNHEKYEKIEHIKSLDPNDRAISPRSGECRFEPGEDGQVRRAKGEKVSESRRVRHGDDNLDGLVPDRPLDQDGEYIATRRDGNAVLHCIAWRDHGRWRRLSDWLEQMPKSADHPMEVTFCSQVALPHAGWPSI